MKPSQFQSQFSIATLKKQPWLVLALLLTILMVIVTAIQDEELESEPKVIAKQFSSRNQQTALSHLPKNKQVTNATYQDQQPSAKPDHHQATGLPARQYASVVNNIFPMQTWEPPPKKIEKNLTRIEPPPVAPPVPLVFQGKIEEDGKVDYLFLQQNKLINLKLGEMVNAQWRLDREDSQYLYWTFIPMNLPQTSLKQKG